MQRARERACGIDDLARCDGSQYVRSEAIPYTSIVAFLIRENIVRLLSVCDGVYTIQYFEEDESQGRPISVRLAQPGQEWKYVQVMRGNSDFEDSDSEE